MSDKNESINEAANGALPPEPLTDEQLNHLFKAARPQPPAQWQERFWQDLETKLEQPARPSAHALSGGNWFRRPWAAAAAALVVILLAVPISQKLAQQSEQDSLQQPAADQTGSMATQPDAHPRLGAHPEMKETTAAGNANQAGQNPALSQKPPSPAQPETPGREGGTETRDQAAPAAGMLDKSSKTIPSSGSSRDEEAKQKMASHLNSADSLARAQLDQTGARLEKMILPLQGELRQIQPGHYEIKVPVQHQQDLEKLIDALSLPHNTLRRGQKSHDQVVFRLDLL